MNKSVDIAMRRAATHRADLTASLAATRAAMPFVGLPRSAVSEISSAPSAKQSVPLMLPLAVLSGVVIGAVVPLTQFEDRRVRSVAAPAAQALWRSAVSAGASLLLERMLTGLVRVMKAAPD
jgi:hypothetical protein